MLRVIDISGKQLGVLNQREALTKAAEAGVDLVEIAPKANPPVAKIVDYKKFQYEQNKKKRASRKAIKSGETKEVWLTPFIAQHDLQARITKGKDLLSESGKLKVVVLFRGRQITRKEFGFEVMNKFIQAIEAKIDKEPHFEGKRLVAIVTKK